MRLYLSKIANGDLRVFYCMLGYSIAEKLTTEQEEEEYYRKLAKKLDVSFYHLTGAAAITDYYVNICVCLKGFKNREDFYRKNRDLTLKKLYDLMEKGNRTDLPSQGFLEMMKDLSDMLWFNGL